MVATDNREVVLVVDDSPESLSMINDALDAEGMTVLVALEGQQALTIASNITPDIILLDAIMPHMDGFETCRLLKLNQELAHIPIIFMTGLSDTGSVVKGLEVGGVDYIQKPINCDELIARMKVHLNTARQTLSAREALDTAGHFIVAVDRTGELLWTTPQAGHLFFQFGIDADRLKKELVSQFENLIEGKVHQVQLSSVSDGVLATNNGVESKSQGKSGDSDQVEYLELKFLSQKADNEYLIRVIVPEKRDEMLSLRNAFPLTGREAEVLLWLARGKSNSEIAIILGISPRTINKHLEQVYRKLNVENRTAAAVIAKGCLDLL